NQRMKSDYDRGQVLLRVASGVKLDQRAAAAYVQAVTPMRSDYERRRTLSALLALRPLPPKAAELAVRATVDMKSDYDRSQVLRDALQGPQADQGDAVFEALGRTKSAYEQRRVLQAVVARDTLTTEMKKGVLMACTSIASDFDRSQVLQAF